MNAQRIVITLSLLFLLGLAGFGLTPAQAQAPTPTYDPFLQPPLPENPTELEHGTYLFWRYCMPCHGDMGQGLTDEFRLKWEADHQNCWARGCHSGRYPNDSFPVPTIVPPLANVGLLSRYTPDSLFEFLRTTHPPEDPGLLSDDEYHALVTFLYHLDNVPLPAATSTPIPSFTPTPSLPPSPEADSPFGLWPIILLAVIVTVLVYLQDSRAR